MLDFKNEQHIHILMKTRTGKPSAGKGVCGWKKSLSKAAADIVAHEYNQAGYPFNQASGMGEFYSWLASSGLGDITLINVGDPYKKRWDMLNTDKFERYCIDFLAQSYGFKKGTHWGVLANGGTDGNMHGIYFGRKALLAKCPKPPVLYVSREAHYSLQKIGDIQNIETRIISTLENGSMDTRDLRRKMLSSRPALIAIAVGGTFKGAIDDQLAISKVVAEVNPPAVYRHIDAALFGGYLPFLRDKFARHIVDATKSQFDSIAVSGHKFLSANEPVGVFICRREVLDSVHENPVEYLNGTIPTINCSRSGFDPLKLYWRLKTLGRSGLAREAEHSLEMAEYFFLQLKSLGVPVWRNPYSNTVIFRRPSRRIVSKYALACASDPNWGDLSHAVVMQYFSKPYVRKMAQDIAGK